MTNKDKENLIKEIDMEIANQESIISNDEKLLEKLKRKEELSFDRDLCRLSISGAHSVKTGLQIAGNIISNYYDDCCYRCSCYHETMKEHTLSEEEKMLHYTKYGEFPEDKVQYVSHECYRSMETESCYCNGDTRLCKKQLYSNR